MYIHPLTVILLNLPVCHYTLYTCTGIVNLISATCLQIDLECQHNITELLVYYHHCNVSIQ